MTPFLWALVGIGAWLVVMILVGCVVDSEVRDGVGRVAVAVILLPVLLLAGLGMKLPKAGRKVTRESLIESLSDAGRWEHRAVGAINWPRGALVWMRVKPAGKR